MKNSKLRRALTLAACAVMLVCLSVGATLAFLTDDDTVTNTFTVGNVEITLDEENVDKKDAAGEDNADEARDQANKYHLLPGHKYVKDPTIHVADSSEDCYVFVEIANGIKDIEAVNAQEDDPDTDIDETKVSIHAQMLAKGWALIPGSETIYYKADAYSAGDDIVVFDFFMIKGDVINTALAEYVTANITVKAYAIQKDGFDTALAAWDAAHDELTMLP